MGSRNEGLSDAVGVLLDIDDTLVDTKGAFRHSIGKIADAHLAAGTDKAEALQFWRDDRHGYYRAYTRGEYTAREQRMLRANDLHAEFGGAAMDDAQYDEWNEGFEQFFQAGWVAHSDAELLLDALDGAGIRYGALSNAQMAYQVKKLERVGLGRMPVLVTVDTLGFGKPDPRVFLEGCTRLGTAPGATYYVGDEYDIDAVAASKAGLLGVWLDRADGWGHEISGEEMAGARVQRIGSLSELTGLSDLRARLGR